MAVQGLGARVKEAIKHQQEPINAQFMAAFCRSIGMNTTRMNENGQLMLQIDKSFVVTFDCQWSDSIAAVAFIGEVGEKFKVEHLKKLLELNFIPMHHGGGSYAIEPGSTRVVIVNSWKVTIITVEEFSKSLEEFINSAEAGQAMFL